MKKSLLIVGLTQLKYILFFCILPANLFGMRVMKGFLPMKWAIVWPDSILPFILIIFTGLKIIK